MSATTKTRIRKIIAGTAAAAAVSVPLALATAAPAEATTSLAGCRVTPLQPTAQRVWVLRNGKWVLDTRVTFTNQVTCVKDRIIQVHDRLFERDGLARQYLGGSAPIRTFAAAGTVNLSTWRWASQINTEAGPDEYYHDVRFKVATINGIFGWTAFEASPLKSV